MSGPLCQVCGEEIAEHLCVYCANCATAHHRDCWNYLGHCSTFACGSKLRAQKAPKSRLHEHPIKINDAGIGWVGSKRVSLPTPNRPHTILTHVDGTYTDTDRQHARLDLDTPLEIFLQKSSLWLLLLAGLVALLNAAFYTQLLLFFSLMMIFTRLFVECTYVLDNVREEILYSRSIFGLTETWKICDFTEVKSVAISARREEIGPNAKGFKYCAVLELPYGVHVQISDETTEHSRVAGFCRQLAEHLGSKSLITSHNPIEFNKNQGNLPMKMSNTDWRTRPFIGRANLGWVIVFIFVLLLNIVSF